MESLKLTIEEIRDKKTRMETSITILISMFNRETGLSVESVDIHTSKLDSGVSEIVFVNTVVKL